MKQTTNNLSWLNHPDLQNLDPQKKEILIDIIENANGKSLQQSFSILMQAQARMRNLGLSFTGKETAVMMELLTKDLSPAEKAKVDLIKKYFPQK